MECGKSRVVFFTLISLTVFGAGAKGGGFPPFSFGSVVKTVGKSFPNIFPKSLTSGKTGEHKKRLKTLFKCELSLF